MHTLSEAVGHQAISCPAHCLLRQSDRLLERRGHQSAWSRTMKREARQSNATGHPKQALVICGTEITSLDRRLSCTSFSPIAQKLRDKSGTSPSDLFLQLGAKWQQRPETPALISRIHTSSSHHAPHQCSISAEEWIRPEANHPLGPRTAPLARLPPTHQHHWSIPQMGSVQGGALPQRGESERTTSPRFHQQPDRLQKEGVAFSGDWSAWSDCVSTTNATGLMLCLALLPW